MDLDKLKAPVDRQLALLGYELVCLEEGRDGRDLVLRLYIDHLDRGPDGNRPITLDDCVAVNDGLVAWLDVEFPSLREQVNLEVSSPGLDRPLVKPEHFQRFQGRLCRLQTAVPLNGQKRFKGWIGTCTPETVTLEEKRMARSRAFPSRPSGRRAWRPSTNRRLHPPGTPSNPRRRNNPTAPA